MLFWNVFDGILLASLAGCIFVWPTQLVSDNQNRWLRILAVGLTAIQLIVDGPRVQLVPAYLIAALFAILLIPRGSVAESSAVRESKEGLVNKLARWTMVIGTGLVLSLSVLFWSFFPRFEYPKPSGPYQIGVRNIRLVDDARMELDTEDPSDHRELLVRISYPMEANESALDPERDSVPDPAMLAARYALLPLWPGTSSAGIIPESWGRIRTNGRVNTPLSSKSNHHPVLIYSHGLGSWPEQNTILIEELVSHGYVVITINHSGLSAGMKRLDGSTIGIEPLMERARQADKVVGNATRRNESRILSKRLEDPSLPIDVRRQLIKELAALRPQPDPLAAVHVLASNDQRFVMNELEKLELHDPTFAGHLDLERVGVFGMSTGGTASHITCVVDHRCKAGINMDGFQSLLVNLDPLPVPFMHITSARDFSHAVLHDQSRAKSYLVRVAGSAHGSFTDVVYTNPRLQLLTKVGIDIIGTIEGERMIQITNDYVLAFFDKHLLGKQEPLLEKPSEQFPEVAFLVRE